jgi:imidazolonepropionase-like amidohydrolase
MGVGTDAASPLNMHDEAMRFEMQALVDSGMTPIQVISAATKTNAEILGQFDDLGTVEAGKLADLVIVRGNPLANIANVGNVDIVVSDGMIFYAETAAAGAVKGVGNAF